MENGTSATAEQVTHSGDSQRAAASATRAAFPSVSQLDPDLSIALQEATRRWLDSVAQDLIRLLRVPCKVIAPLRQSASSDRGIGVDEAGAWGQVEGLPEMRVLITLSRRFAVAICERVYGAPLNAGENRELSAAEQALLAEVLRKWLTLLSRVYQGPPIRATSGPSERDRSEVAEAGDWVRLSGDVVCQEVRGTLNLMLSAATVRYLFGDTPPPMRSDPGLPAVLARLGNVPVEVRGVLGSSELALQDLWQLRPGDVIMLDRLAHEPVDFVVDDRVWMNARAGQSGDRVALEMIAGGDSAGSETHDGKRER